MLVVPNFAMIRAIWTTSGLSSLMVNDTAEKPPHRQMVQFWKANIDALFQAIEEAAASRRQIASAGKLSADTLKKALDGHRISDAKANGIIKGLKTFSVNAEKVKLFSPDNSN